MWAKYVKAQDGSLIKLGWFYMSERDGNTGVMVNRVSKFQVRRSLRRSATSIFPILIVGQNTYGCKRVWASGRSYLSPVGWYVGCKLFYDDNLETVKKWAGV